MMANSQVSTGSSYRCGNVIPMDEVYWIERRTGGAHHSYTRPSIEYKILQ